MGKRALRVGVVIPAGGAGERFGTARPKQFMSLHGKPVLQRTMEALHAVPAVGEIVVVVPERYLERVERLAASAGLRKVKRVVSAGRERQDSVWNGLNAFTRCPDIVLVHDAVRPLVTRSLVEEVIRASSRYGAAVAGTRVHDTVKIEGRKGVYARTLDRTRLWTVQTPQGFRYSVLLKGHLAARRDGFLGTDEASLVERLRVPVRIVEGSMRNVKITTREDLAVARRLWKLR